MPSQHGTLRIDQPKGEIRPLMIRTAEIKNFRGFESLEISDCKLVNLIVGDNGVGKTALLEALHLPGCQSPGKALGFRVNRGFTPEIAVSGTQEEIERTLWGELFYDFDLAKIVSLNLIGDDGDSRELTIARSERPTIVPLQSAVQGAVAPLAFRFAGPGERKIEFSVAVGEKGLSIDPPDGPQVRPSGHFFSVSPNYTVEDVSRRYSALRKLGLSDEFDEHYLRLFPWLSDISVEWHGGAWVLHARTSKGGQIMPLNLISHGTTRVAAILVSMPLAAGGSVMIDEIDGGLYYERMPAVWRSLIHYAKTHRVQLFASTHSKECLQALATAAGEDFSDIALWRLSRGETQPEFKAFSGKQLLGGIERGVEPR